MVITFPKEVEQIYTAELVRLFHNKSRFFEVNVIPLDAEKSQEVSRRTIALGQFRAGILEKHYKKKKGLSESKMAEARKTVEQQQAEILNSISRELALDGRPVTAEEIKTDLFEKNPDEYIDYNRLSIMPDIDQALSKNTNSLLLITRSKLGSSFNLMVTRHWNDILKNHIAAENQAFGLKIPSISSSAFIVRLVIYLQTMIEEKDLQTASNLELLGIDGHLYRLVYMLDLDSQLKSVQAELHSLAPSDRPSQYKFFIHIFKNHCLCRSTPITWSQGHILFFIYRLHCRFPLIFKKEGLEKDSLKLLSAGADYWEKAHDASTQEFKYLNKLMSRLFRIPQLLRSLDFRVMADIDIDDIQSRLDLNPRMADALGKIQSII